MEEIIGKYSTAIVYADEIEEQAARQIRTLCDQSFTENCRS